MRPALAAGVLAGLLLGSGAVAAEEILERDWLQKDRELFEAWSKTLDPGDSSPQAFLESLHTVESPLDRPRELGLGIQVVHGVRPGGYCSARAAMLVHEGAIAQLQITATCSAKAWPRLGSFLAEKWGPRGHDLKHRGYEGREILWSQETRVAALRRALAAELGPPEPADVPPALADAVEELTSPFASSHVSFIGGCYFAGSDPAGKKAIDALVKARRWDLVRLAARGLNPEGRVYAAHALLGAPADRRSPADGPLIEHIRALDIPIAVCNGCIVSSARAAKLLSATRP